MTPDQEKSPPKEIFFSVVIPLYNKQSHILRAANSVLAQTYTKFELIVVNDGSTDGSIDALTPVIDRIILINQENRGESAARNMGIRTSKYPYIAFLDADDEWDNDFLQTIVSMIVSRHECYILSTNYRKKTRNNIVTAIPKQKEMISEIDYFEIARKGNTPVCSSSVCISSELFNQIGYFPEGISLYPDLYFWTKAALNFKFLFHSEPKATYHRDAENRVCNAIIPDATDTPFEAIIQQGEDIGSLQGDRLYYAKEFLCHYKLQNSFKALTQYEAIEARNILRHTDPVNWLQKLKKPIYFIVSLLPARIVHYVWRLVRNR